jgi:hypothetical protein
MNIFNYLQTYISEKIAPIIIRFVDLTFLSFLLLYRIYYYFLHSLSKDYVSSRILLPIVDLSIPNIKHKKIHSVEGDIPVDIDSTILFLCPTTLIDKLPINQYPVVVNGYPVGYKVTIKNGECTLKSKIMASAESQVLKNLNQVIEFSIGAFGSFFTGFIGPPNTSPSIFNNRLFLSGDFGPITECDPYSLNHISYIGNPTDLKLPLVYKSALLTGIMQKTSDAHPDFNNKDYYFYHKYMLNTDIYLSRFTNKDKLETKLLVNYDKKLVGYHGFGDGIFSIFNAFRENLMHESHSTSKHIIGCYGMFSYDLLHGLFPLFKHQVLYNKVFVIVKKDDFELSGDTIQTHIILIPDIKPLHFIPEYNEKDEIITLYAIDNGSIDISSPYGFEDTNIFGKKYNNNMIGHIPFDSCMKNGGINRIMISTKTYSIVENIRLEDPNFTASFYYSPKYDINNNLSQIFISSSGSDPNMMLKRTYDTFKDVDKLPSINTYKNKKLITSSVWCLDIKSFTFKSYYMFPENSYCFNPQYVNPNYVLCPIKILQNGTYMDQIWIFTTNLSVGPICKLDGFQFMNFMTHSTIITDTMNRQSDYYIPYIDWFNPDILNEKTKIKCLNDIANYK